MRLTVARCGRGVPGSSLQSGSLESGSRTHRAVQVPSCFGEQVRPGFGTSLDQLWLALSDVLVGQIVTTITDLFAGFLG